MMKNILLATDFSQNAHMAAIHAAGLARHTGARLIIFHVLDPVLTGEHEPGGEEAASEEEVQEKLDILAAELYSLFGISITRLLKPGDAVREIPALARITAADLLITGTRGDDLHSDRFLGKVAEQLVASSSSPLVCIPADALLSLPEELRLIRDKKPGCCNAAGLQLLSRIIDLIGSDTAVAE